MPSKFKEFRRSIVSATALGRKKHGGHGHGHEYDSEDFDHHHHHRPGEFGDFDLASPASPLSASGASAQSSAAFLPHSPTPSSRGSIRRRRRMSEQPERKKSSPHRQHRRKRAGTVSGTDPTSNNDVVSDHLPAVPAINVKDKKQRPVSWTSLSPRWSPLPLPPQRGVISGLPRSESTGLACIASLDLELPPAVASVSPRSSTPVAAPTVTIGAPPSPTPPAPLAPILRAPGVAPLRRSSTLPSIPQSAPAPVISLSPVVASPLQYTSPLPVPSPAVSPRPSMDAGSRTQLPTTTSLEPSRQAPDATRVPVSPASVPPPVAEVVAATTTPATVPGVKATTAMRPSKSIMERLFPSEEMERRANAEKKAPAPGRVYVFDVMSEEEPAVPKDGKEPLAKTRDLPDSHLARLQESERRAPLEYRTSPWVLAGSSLVFFVTHLELVPRMFVGGRRTDVKGSSSAVLGQATMLAVSGVITILGTVSLLACVPTVAAVCLFAFVAERCQGPPTRVSDRPDVTNAPTADREAWFFVNGVATTGSGAQDDINELHGLVRRPITAIVNHSLGLWFDLVQSVMQRDLGLATKDLREGYKYIHEAVNNPAMERVVVIAHSQGAILTSAWIDQLVADLPAHLLAKVEVYTFGSAANHFSLHAYALARVEHFANMFDYVARHGVLDHCRGGAYAPGVDDTVKAVYGRYPGRVFARNRTGHMLLDHYLNPADSILDDPEVQVTSRFAAYAGGGLPLPPAHAGAAVTSSRSSSGSGTTTTIVTPGDTTPYSTDRESRDRDGPMPCLPRPPNTKRGRSFKFGKSRTDRVSSRG